jgi:UV DNA damage endonuclease
MVKEETAVKTELDVPSRGSDTTLVQALEHLPPGGLKIPPSTASDDDLTPPPELAASPEKDDSPQHEQTVTPASTKRKRASKKDVSYADDHEADAGSEFEGGDGSAEEEKVTPKKPRKKAVKIKGEPGEADVREKTPKKPTPKKSRIAKDEPEFDDEGNEIVKKKRKAKVYVPKVYEIPDVARKDTTTFRGGSAAGERGWR